MRESPNWIFIKYYTGYYRVSQRQVGTFWPHVILTTVIKFNELFCTYRSYMEPKNVKMSLEHPVLVSSRCSIISGQEAAAEGRRDYQAAGHTALPIGH